MHFAGCLSFAAALAAPIVASPLPSTAVDLSQEKPPTFSVKQISKGVKLKPSLAVAMLKTYNKFGKIAPADVHKAAARVQAAIAAKGPSVAAALTQQQGSVVANPASYDEEYACSVNVGGQNMVLNFDTGSSDLWVFSNLLPAAQQSGHTIYQVTPASQIPNQTWDITYGDGSGASGIVYTQTVVVGGATATAQAVEAATSISSSFLGDTFDNGLLGLAFSNINTVSPVQQSTFFDNVKSSLQQPLFTAALKHNSPGNYNFGYIDPAAYTGSITYTPVSTQNGFWEFQGGAYAIGGKQYPTAVGDSILDTGTTLLYLPTKLVNNYYASVRGASYSTNYGGYLFPCKSILPNLTLYINGTPMVVPGFLLNYAPVSWTTCFGGLQANTGIGFSIYGDIFLKAVFAVFDQTQSTPRLGFAKPTSW